MVAETTRKAKSERRSRQEWPQIRVLKRNSRKIWEVDTGVSGRMRQRFDNEASATSYAEMLRSQRRNSGMNAFTPTAAQRENIRAALAMLRRSGAKFRQAAASFANQGPMAGANKTMTDLWQELASFKDRLQQKSPEYMNDLRARLRKFTGQGDNQTKSTTRKASATVGRSVSRVTSAPGSAGKAAGLSSGVTAAVPKRPKSTRRKKKGSATTARKAAGTKRSRGTRAKTRSNATRSKSVRSRASKSKASGQTA